jgi:hypothetical protein
LNAPGIGAPFAVVHGHCTDIAVDLGIALALSKILSSKATDHQAESTVHMGYFWTEVLLEFIGFITRERETLLLIWT